MPEHIRETFLDDPENVRLRAACERLGFSFDDERCLEAAPRSCALHQAGGRAAEIALIERALPQAMDGPPSFSEAIPGKLHRVQRVLTCLGDHTSTIARSAFRNCTTTPVRACAIVS